MIPMERVPEEKRDQMRKLMMKFGEQPEAKALRKRLINGGGGGERGEEFMKIKMRELALFRGFVAKEAPGLEVYVPERPPKAPPFGRDGDRRERERGRLRDGGERERGNPLPQ